MSDRKLSRYRNMYMGDIFTEPSELNSRMSKLLWTDIHTLESAYGVSPHDILKSIKDLEEGEALSGVKPATQFKYPPLKGLWHKHYFSAHFIMPNIRSGLGKHGAGRILNDVMTLGKPATWKMIREAAHRIVHDSIEMRDANKKLTGEWIIYARHMEKNYYLCCNAHNAGDQFIYDRIMAHCVRDFPELPAWLNDETG